MAKVVVDGTSEWLAAIANKFASMVNDELGIGIAACQVSGTAGTPVAGTTMGFNSAVTDIGTGNYSVTLQTNFNSTPIYLAFGFVSGGAFCTVCLESESAAGCTVRCYSHDGSAIDAVVNILAVGIRA